MTTRNEHLQTNPVRNSIKRATNLALLVAMLLGASGLITVLVAMGANFALRASPSLAPPSAEEREAAPEPITALPAHGLTKPIQIATNRADRKIMLQIIEDAVTRNGGYVIQELGETHHVYSAPHQVAVLLHEYSDARENAYWPDLEAYQELANNMATVTGTADTQVNISITAPMYEHQTLLTATMVAVYAIIVGIIIVSFTVILIAMFDPLGSKTPTPDHTMGKGTEHD